METAIIGVIGAMEQEIRLLRERLEAAKETKLGPIVCHEGSLDGKAVVLIQSGIGKVNAAVATALLLDHFRPRFVINTGSAGGLAGDLGFGDIVVSDRVLHHDVDVTGFGYADGQIPGQAPAFIADPKLVDLAMKAAAALIAEAVLPASIALSRGAIASGDIFVKDDDLRAAILRRFPGVRAVEMEGAAIAQTCALFSVPFVIIRAISDVAGKESPLNFAEFLPLAAERSSLLVTRMVREA